MREIELGPCERCHQRQAEWSPVSLRAHGHRDLCHDCYLELRDILRTAKDQGERLAKFADGELVPV